MRVDAKQLFAHQAFVSASGANFKAGEMDCLLEFEKQLEKEGHLTRKKMDEMREQLTKEMLEMSQKVKQEPMPDPSSIFDYVYKGQKGKYW